ncbi:dyslexia-associated protein KIAA0319-like protein isoform X1 [Callorhinchus milii]|uniref:dyslexia-associated protein KIAA0319-like protein isoform X1 n=1 Tax=Callorhinchus milii TaxID=7868 RepID=UPI001C3F747B|nr:dyslexia-associated protein KIAA0319-like protein isoform X1 [Callorhinchus milii]
MAMDWRLEHILVPLKPSIRIGVLVKWTYFGKLKHLFCICFCLTMLTPFTSANTENCGRVTTYSGAFPRHGFGSQLAERYLEESGSVELCTRACCQRCECNVAWLLEGKCYILDCRGQRKFQLVKTSRPDSVVVILDKFPAGCTDSWDTSDKISNGRFLDKAPGTRTSARLVQTNRNWVNTGRFSDRPFPADQNKVLSRTKRKAAALSDHVTELPPINKGPGLLKVTEQQSGGNKTLNLFAGERGNQSTKQPRRRQRNLQVTRENLKDPNIIASRRKIEHTTPTVDERNPGEIQTSPPEVLKGSSLPNLASFAAVTLISTLPNLPVNAKLSQVNDTGDGVTETVPVVTAPMPTLNTQPGLEKPSVVAPITTTESKTRATTIGTKKPEMKELIVSAGDNVEVTLPKDEVELNAYVLQNAPAGTSYEYEWELITHLQDYSGEMEGKHSKTLKLSKLSVGFYTFKLIVKGDNAYGEGSVNVTVKLAPRVNKWPVAIVSPKFQEISLPTTSTFIDGSQSTDDDKIIRYEWEEVKGPLREEKVSANTPILKLTNLVPGNYTFSLTVVDSDGASNSTTATLTVYKAVDYPPVANAGPNQVITLPKNSITLYGNQSTDDHGIVSYEWSLSPKSKDKVVETQGVRTSSLQLSTMKEGDYIFQLTVMDSAGQQDTAEVMVIVQPENNKPPVADAGPDKELTLPVDSTTLDGGKSTDDQKIVSYLWEQASGPDGAKIENADSAVATVTGLRVGSYVFILTVKDDRNLQSHHPVSVIVREESNKAPVAKIAKNVVVTLPTNTAMLDGSKSSDDKGIVSCLWIRDESSPAAGDVLNASDHQAVLFLSNLVEGTYTFHLKVTDAKGESNVDRATVEVKPDPRKNDLVEIILDISVSQLTERQKGMLIRQIAVLLGVLDSDIIVHRIQPYTEQSTQIIICVKNGQSQHVMKGQDVARILKNKFRKQKSDFLIFRALQVDTVICQLNCSEHGRCDSFNKRCICDPFWMENFIRVQLGDGESNCEWSVLYVVIAAFVILVTTGILIWLALCCCKRRKGKPRRKSKYKILDGTDDHESLELKSSSKPVGRLKTPGQHTSLMISDSELESDEAIFTWPDREKGKLLRKQNGSIHNGQVSPKTKKQREEIL